MTTTMTLSESTAGAASTYGTAFYGYATGTYGSLGGSVGATVTLSETSLASLTASEALPTTVTLTEA